MGKIKSGTIPHRGKIPEPSKPKTEGLNFSFKHLDLDGDADFCLAHGRDGYPITLLQRMKDMSGLRIDEFRTSRSLRAHLIDWEGTSRPDGFSHLNEYLREIPAWQFQLTSNEHGRVHGFMIDDTFFIVWLDPLHRLYP